MAAVREPCAVARTWTSKTPDSSAARANTCRTSPWLSVTRFEAPYDVVAPVSTSVIVIVIRTPAAPGSHGNGAPGLSVIRAPTVTVTRESGA